MKLFSIQEANSLIPDLKRHFAAIKQARPLLSRYEADARRASSKSDKGGGMTNGVSYVTAIMKMRDALQAVTDLGVEVKDIERGLCDFPHLMEGRVVYLCWLFGEDRIEFWHDIESGFAGRQKL